MRALTALALVLVSQAVFASAPLPKIAVMTPVDTATTIDLTTGAPIDVVVSAVPAPTPVVTAPTPVPVTTVPVDPLAADKAASISDLQTFNLNATTLDTLTSTINNTTSTTPDGVVDIGVTLPDIPTGPAPAVDPGNAQINYTGLIPANLIQPTSVDDVRENAQRLLDEASKSLTGVTDPSIRAMAQRMMLAQQGQQVTNPTPTGGGSGGTGGGGGGRIHWVEIPVVL